MTESSLLRYPRGRNHLLEYALTEVIKKKTRLGMWLFDTEDTVLLFYNRRRASEKRPQNGICRYRLLGPFHSLTGKALMFGQNFKASIKVKLEKKYECKTTTKWSMKVWHFVSKSESSKMCVVTTEMILITRQQMNTQVTPRDLSGSRVICDAVWFSFSFVWKNSSTLFHPSLPLP